MISPFGGTYLLTFWDFACIALSPSPIHIIKPQNSQWHNKKKYWWRKRMCFQWGGTWNWWNAWRNQICWGYVKFQLDKWIEKQRKHENVHKNHNIEMYHFHPISEVFVFLLFPIVFICHLPCLSSAFLPSHLMPFFFILIIHYMIHHLAALQLYKQRLAYLFFYIAKTTVLFRIDCEIQGVLAKHGQRIQDRNLVKTNKSSF